LARSATAPVGIIHTGPLDLSIGETLHELREEIHRLKARRVVIDSLSGFELALAPTFREDFRESLYRLVATLTGMGLTVMMTAELEDSCTDLRFSPHGTAFLTDAVILQRYVEIGRSVRACDGRRQGPCERPQQRPPPVRDHHQWHCRG
jgi:circadian clock protein KaiC